MSIKSREFMDMSLGDPDGSFEFLARDAFETAVKQNHQYQLLGNTNPLMRKLYAPIQDYLKERGFKSDGWHGIPNSDLLFTSGTTHAYSMIIDYLARDVHKYNERQKEGEQIKPVILMPVPTYGMFFPQPKRLGVEIVKIPRDMDHGGTLDPLLVHETIERVNDEGKRVIAYYDSNPHNPLGIIRGEQETRDLAMIFNHHSDQYQDQDRENIRRDNAQAEFDFDGDNIMFCRGGRVFDGPASRIRMIDDMVYWGLEYDGAEKPFSFAQVNGRAYKDSFVLFGPSKAGMAAARAGLIYAKSDDIYELRDLMIDRVYSPTSYAFHAMSGYFNDDEPYKTMRERHLKDLNARHEYAGKLMKALVNGREGLVGVPKDMREKMQRDLMRYEGLTEKQAERRLLQGIDGVRVISNPKAGFFHVLDFSGLKGRQYDNDYVRGKVYGGYTDMEDEYAMEHLFRAMSMSYASGTWMGLDVKQMLGRVTFAMSPAKIIEFADRLEDVASLALTSDQVNDLNNKFSL